MKTVKFRVWDKKEKKMFAVSDLQFEDQRKLNSPTICGIGTFTNFEINSEIDKIDLMQAIGIDDKASQMIYEKDLIKFLDRIWLVGYLGFFASFMFIDCNDNLVSLPAQIERRQAQKFEIVGNLWENPDLLGLGTKSVPNTLF